MKNFLLFFYLIVASAVFGQSRSLAIYKADEFYEKAQYESALINYRLALSDSLVGLMKTIPYEADLAALKIDNKKKEVGATREVRLRDYVMHRIAMCYHFMADYNHAAGAFRTSAETGAFPEDKYYLGVSEMNLAEYRGAISSFENYIQLPQKNDTLERLSLKAMMGCQFALDSTRSMKKLEVAMEDSIFNKGTASFAPMFYDKDQRIMFTSAREGGVILDPKKQQSEYLCDLYYAERDGDGWKEATNFGRPLNSAQHDGSGAMHKNAVYFTHWSDANRNKQEIWMGRMINYKFFESYKLGPAVNVEGYRSINPHVTVDGSTMYFSSDRPGGKGGFDIWKIALDSNGNVAGQPVNLGEPVNSEADEKTPFFHEASSTLFFSSNGHYSIGGLDNFKSTYDRDKDVYALPVNMGIPVNSEKDDSYLVWDTYMDQGYFSSDREPCPSEHCYDIYRMESAPIKIILEGYTYNAETEEILPNANMTFKDVRSVFPTFTLKSDEKGYYRTELKQFWEVFVKAQKPKFFADATTVDCRKITEDAVLNRDFYLRPIPDAEIKIEGIEYDFDSDKLRPASLVVLDKLFEFLEINDNLVVEINSHTDYVGPDIYNLDLSQRRAKSCVNYLINKGISPERIIPKGYGESQPTILLDANEKPILDEAGQPIVLTMDYILKQSKEKQAEYNQRNRRTTFRVINETYQNP